MIFETKLLLFWQLLFSYHGLQHPTLNSNFLSLRVYWALATALLFEFHVVYWRPQCQTAPRLPLCQAVGLLWPRGKGLTLPLPRGLRVGLSSWSSDPKVRASLWWVGSLIWLPSHPHLTSFTPSVLPGTLDDIVKGILGWELSSLVRNWQVWERRARQPRWGIQDDSLVREVVSDTCTEKQKLSRSSAKSPRLIFLPSCCCCFC